MPVQTGTVLEILAECFERCKGNWETIQGVSWRRQMTYLGPVVPRDLSNL
jgi:hypothetical protein